MPKSSVLRLPGVLPFVVGRLVRALGGSMLTMALGWEVYERTHSPLALGLLGLAQVVPVVALVLRAGNVADSYPRRVIGALTQVAQALVAIGIAAVSYYRAPIACVYALLVVAGTAGAFAVPSISALIPDMVEPEHRREANAWSSIALELGVVLGPGAAGGLITRLGSATPLYLVAAATGFFFAFIVSRLPARGLHIPATRPRTPRELLAGLRFVLGCQELLGAFVLDFVAVLLGGVMALMPIFAKEILHVGPEGLGWLLAAAPLGATLCMLVQTRMKSWAHSGWVLLVSVALYGVATLAFGFSRSFGWSLAFLFLTGVFDALSLIIRRTLEQMVTPEHLRGRVGAVNSVFVGMSDELGEFESGAAAWLFGAVRAVLLGGVATLVMVAIATLAWPALRRMRRLDELAPRDELAQEVVREA